MKSILFQKLFWLSTVEANCSSDIKSFSWWVEFFFSHRKWEQFCKQNTNCTRYIRYFQQAHTSLSFVSFKSTEYWFLILFFGTFEQTLPKGDFFLFSYFILTTITVFRPFLCTKIEMLILKHTKKVTKFFKYICLFFLT